MLKTIKKVKKPVRSISGVVIVAAMTKPFPCPHGKCIYCPGGTDWRTPQSYVEKSPVVLRAKALNYDPYEQVRQRLLQYVKMGHTPSKVELIVMGGTFPSFPLDYQEWFITQALEAMNRFPRAKKRKWVYLDDAIRRNEKANVRCVGMTIETRPDWAKPHHIERFLRYGVTRVELGVQSIYDDVLRLVRRGHTVRDTIIATKHLKDSGFKVCYHIMPGLPGSDFKRDLDMMKKLFDDPNFRPDMLKIYPTLVIPGTRLYEMWRKGEYKAYDDVTLVDLIAKMKALVPKYVRIMRIQRDIPIEYVAAGCKIGNLRQVVRQYMLRKGMKCKCIRCREVGHKMLREGKVPDPDNIKMTRIEYTASDGIEIFLSFEDIRNEILVGFLRLRIPSTDSIRKEIDEKSSIVRELHVYGPSIPVGERNTGGWQHRGYGRQLLHEAERISYEEFDKKRIFVISGIGVRDYYRRLGYRKYPCSFYMYKNLP